MITVIAIIVFVAVLAYIGNTFSDFYLDMDDRMGEIEADVDTLKRDVDVIKNALQRREDDGK